jgi:hypothetical protein
MSDGKTNIAIGDENGRVFLRFQKPMAWIALDPQNAFDIGEAIARAAHKARFGETPTDSAYLAQQVKARLTDQLRDRLIINISTMLRSLQEQGKSPGQMALHVVDTILSEVA